MKIKQWIVRNPVTGVICAVALLWACCWISDQNQPPNPGPNLYENGLAQEAIRDAGYQCDEVVGIIFHDLDSGKKVFCVGAINGFSYTYEFRDRGGQIAIVPVD